MNMNEIGLLLLPGMDGTSQLFEPLLTSLSAHSGAKCVVYPQDIPSSYAELVKKIGDGYPVVDPFVIVAESYSTPIAILCAADAPANLKGIVLCAGFAASPIYGWKRWLAWTLAPIVFRIPLTRWGIRRYLAGDDASEELVLTVQRTIRQVKSSVLVTRLREVLRCDVRGALASVAVPMLYLRAEQDRLVGRECGEEILRLQPLATNASIAGPHLLLQQQPEKAYAAVAQFIRKIV